MPYDYSTAAVLAQDVFAELVKLPNTEYQLCRIEKAKALKIRVTTLDAEVDKLRPKSVDTGADNGGAIILSEPEPWNLPVDGAELLASIIEVFNKYIILPEGAAIALALFVIHTYVLEAADASPIIAISSPEKRCGKTVVLEILQALVYRPLPASNITAAALFRTIEAFHPTMLIDEADSFLQDNEDLRGVLNSGHRKPTAVIIRTSGDNFEPKTFSTWCPKAIALIGKLPSTLEDRSIVITMRRKSPNETVDRVRHRVLANETADLRRKAARWAADNMETLRESDPVVPEALDDRAADCWRPLFAISIVADGDWPKNARTAALALSSGDAATDSSAPVLLLSDIKAMFERRNTDRLSSDDIVAELVGMEERPWPEWKGGKPISKSQLARVLGRFNVSPKTIRTGTGTPKGYLLEQFDDAFSRYIPCQSATPPQTNAGAGLDEFSKRNTIEDVAVCEIDNGNGFNGVADVADRPPQMVARIEEVTTGFGNYGGLAQTSRKEVL